MRSHGWRPLAAVAFTTVVWASAFAGIRAGLEAYGWGELALLRFTVAVALLLTYAALSRIRLPDARDLGAIALAGFLGIDVYHLGLNFGETRVAAGPASLLISAVPVVTALLAWVFLKERLGAWGWAGMLVGFAGVAVISLSASGGVRFEPAALAIMAAAVGESVYFIMIKPMMRRYSVMELTVYTFVAGWVFMLPFLPGLVRAVPRAPAHATLSAVYLGVFPAALAYLAWNFALSRMPTGTTMSFLYFTPALAILIAWVWLGELPGVLPVLGGVVVTVGVVLVNTFGSAATQLTEEL
ncbi:MAG: DMT family transporter [Coriobacteriia bacterium]|nr:DMT family transporter [Coriobacteriia bacterium]